MEDGALVVVIDTVGTRADTAGAWVQVTDLIILVAVAAPSPVDVEIVAAVVTVEHKRVSATAATTVVLDRIIQVQVGF